MMELTALLKRLLRAVLFVPVTLVLLFEEWGWEPLSRLFARLAKLPFWAWVEKKIVGLGPWQAMLVFAVPGLTLLPVKLLALYLFGQGQATLGLVLLVTAKLLGTALLARLFQLTQPALMQLRWFAYWYPRWKIWKDTWLTSVRQSWVWRAARRLKIAVKNAVKAASKASR
jgi:hypothetical protein